MKNIYYFDKINIYSNGVAFVSSDEPIGTIWYVHSFKKFLNFLRQTKLQDNLKYDIVSTSTSRLVDETPRSFDYLIQYFANLVYENSAPKKEELVDFYNKAKQIYEDAKEDKKLLLADPNELIK